MRGSWARLSAVAALVLIAAGTVADGQELRDRDRTLAASRQIAADLRKARMHYGPFYLLSSIQLADIGYDQQFFVPTADTRSNLSFGVSAPQRLYFTPNRKVYFSASFTPDWNRIHGTSSGSQTGYRSRGDAQFLFNHLYVDAYAARDNTLHADTGELSSLLTRRTTEIGVTGELKYSSRTSTTYTALTRGNTYPTGQNSFQPPDLPVNLLDLSEHSYRASLLHKTFPLTSLFVAGEYSGYSFANAAFKNSHRSYAGAGAIYESGRSSLHLEGGYVLLDFIRDNQHDFRGAVGNAAFDHRFNDKWRGGAAYSRDLSFSIFANNNFYVANRASASTAYELTRRLSIAAQYAYIVDVYDLPTVGSKSGLLERRRDTISFPSIGWTYAFDRLAGGFDVGYLKRTSNFPVPEADGIRVIVRLSLNL